MSRSSWKSGSQLAIAQAPSSHFSVAFVIVPMHESPQAPQLRTSLSRS
jgi:hypothetical protein